MSQTERRAQRHLKQVQDEQWPLMRQHRRETLENRGQEEFIHVFIARHRPQSNGIAERFVQTLKDWLADKSWSDDQELAALLRQFLDEYNDRPHQGLPISGLSPNEFANRIWLM